MSLRLGEGVKAFKDTFWNRKRVEANITTRELADMFGLKEGTLSAYFTGYLMPNEHIIDELCDYFGVDTIEGTREFIKAHKSYEAEHSNKVMKIKAKKKTKPVSVESEVKPAVKVESKSEVKGMNNAEKMNDILRLVYSSRKLDYDTFCKLSQMSFDRLKETVYSKVDYAVYTTIENIIDDKYIKVENFEDKWSI